MKTLTFTNKDEILIIMDVKEERLRLNNLIFNNKTELFGYLEAGKVLPDTFEYDGIDVELTIVSQDITLYMSVEDNNISSSFSISITNTGGVVSIDINQKV